MLRLDARYVRSGVAVVTDKMRTVANLFTMLDLQYALLALGARARCRLMTLALETGQN